MQRDSKSFQDSAFTCKETRQTHTWSAITSAWIIRCSIFSLRKTPIRNLLSKRLIEIVWRALMLKQKLMVQFRQSIVLLNYLWLSMTTHSTSMVPAQSKMKLAYRSKLYSRTTRRILCKSTVPSRFKLLFRHTRQIVADQTNNLTLSQLFQTVTSH